MIQMKILDKFKEMFAKIFNREEQPKALPEAVSMNNNLKTFYREDGTTINISPILDKLGNQVYEQVLNHRTGQIQYMPKYNICSEEIRNLTGSDMTNILMDVDIKLLQDPTYSSYIANTLLGTNRISKIMNEYERYAGGIEINDVGEVRGKYIDNGIIAGLKANRQENFARYQEEQARREAEREAEIKEYAESQGVNIKTSHAEDLSKYR